MYNYIEIIDKKTSEVVSRMDVTKESERNRERILRGMDINLYHVSLYVKENNSVTKLEEI